MIILRELKETAFKRIECVNQMKKEFLIMVKRWLVIAKASKDHPCENADRVATNTKSKANLKQI